mmetsp:Transcript_30108/g.46157  ORF Transcript_30108/g.46157 Transcript_30108/m.46157 type:complete len:310 (-) Transcript_30108:137-1066(-)
MNRVLSNSSLSTTMNEPAFAPERLSNAPPPPEKRQRTNKEGLINESFTSTIAGDGVAVMASLLFGTSAEGGETAASGEDTSSSSHHTFNLLYTDDEYDDESSASTETYRKRKLNKHDMIWNQMFQRLLLYKQQHGDCLVPQTYPQDLKLGRWVLTQRQKNKQLPLERRKRLEQVGFVWHSSQQGWDAMFECLVEYKKKHGDCLVPQNYAENSKLGRWVHKQRERKRSSLSFSRVKRLDSIGFVWSSQAAVWEKMFSKLSAFRDQVGNCSVPYNYEPDPPLGRWVYLQRRQKCYHSLDRIKKLESLGFQW